jgi:membrane fusion protein, multidrug efflux system
MAPSEATQAVPLAPPATPPAEAPKASRGRRPFIILGVVVGLMAASIGGYAVATAGQEATDDAQVEADVVPLAARVSGAVLSVAVVENQSVKKGDVILQLDPVDYEARVRQAEAELATANAQAVVADSQAQVTEASARGGLTTAKANFSGSSVGVASAAANIAAARATLLRATADARKAELDLERAKELRAANAVPQERLDNAQAARDATEAALQAAQAQLAASEEARRAALSRVDEAKGRLDQSESIDAQIAAARAAADLAHARVKSAQATLDLANNQLGYTKVVAPADGVVSRLGVHEGQLIQLGQPLASLVPHVTYVVANFKETQVGRIAQGQRVEVVLDAWPGKALEGVVESVAGGTGSRFSLMPPDNASGNFVKVVQRVPVRIAWKDPPKDLPLRAGLSADVTVHVR